MGIVGWLVAGVVPLGAALLFVPKELWKRWRGRLVDDLDRALRRRVSRFDHRYREFVLGGLRFIDLKGLATVGFYTPELDEVYVDVSLVHRPPHEVPEDMLASLPAAMTERHSIEDFIGNSQSVVLAVIGAPGSGKTTLLRHTARLICHNRRGRRRTVPILLYLRDHIEAIVSTPDMALPTLVRGTLGRYALDEPPGWLEQRLAGGACVVLLDGMDEVSRPEERRIVAGWVEHQVSQYPNNDYVITSRPHGYRTASINGAAVVQVRAFTDEQVTRFVRNWYLAIEQHSTQVASENVRVRAASTAEDLLKRLSQTPALYDLAVNPLLLTMIANVHHYRGTLPGSRADLYSEICQVMLWRRQEAKKLPIELSGDKKETLLCGLAFSMMRHRVRDLTRSEALAEIRSALLRMSVPLTEHEFLAEVCRYGLLIERESGLYSFSHLTFQESLAANHIRAKGLVGVLVDAVDDSWWRETTLLHAARSDADPIVEACLEVGTVTALSLASDCAEQSNDLAPELRARLHSLLDIEHGGLDLRRRVAVQISRHLRDVIGGVCVRPVSTGIYRLFLQETGHSRPDGSNPDVDAPVVGVRGSDAVAFVHWVNRIAGGGESRYRLPSSGEMDHPAVQRALTRTQPLCAWMESQNGPVLWTPPGSDQPGTVSTETLTQHIEQDLERAAPLLARLLLIQCSAAIFRYNRESIAERCGKFAYHLTKITARRNVKRVAVLVDDLAITHDCDRDLTLLRSEITKIAAAVLSVRVDRDRAALPSDPDFNPNHPPFVKAQQDYELSEHKLSDLVLNSATDLKDLRSRHELPLRALSQSLDHAFNSHQVENWLRQFSEEFVHLSGIATFTDVVVFDALSDQVRDGCEKLLTLLKRTTVPAWANSVPHRLNDNAVAVFNRQKQLTIDMATRIRLAALCLAAEADARDGKPIGDTFRHVAAGITLMERRTTQRTSARETIVIATRSTQE